MAGSSLSAKARARSIAHRWGAVCALSATEQAALGIRYDEEDDAAAETFLVMLTPGKADIVDQIPGAAVAVAASASGTLFVLDARGVVHVKGKKHRLSSPRALVAWADGAALAAADRLWLFTADGTEARPGPKVVARRLASSSNALLIATDDGKLLCSDGTSEREIDLPGGGQMSALAIDDDRRVVAASGKTLLLGNDQHLTSVATAPFEIHCVALHKGRALLSSRAHGLFAYDDEEKRVVPLKPSLRAHTLSVKGGVLAAASDLFVATSDDGSEFLTRDLAPFVRLADQRLPRFYPNEDSSNV